MNYCIVLSLVLFFFNAGCGRDSDPVENPSPISLSGKADVDLPQSWAQRDVLFACWLDPNMVREPNAIRFCYFSDGAVLWTKSPEDWSSRLLVGEISLEKRATLQKVLDHLNALELKEKRDARIHMDTVKMYWVSEGRPILLQFHDVDAYINETRALDSLWIEAKEIGRDFLPEIGQLFHPPERGVLPLNLKRHDKVD